MMWNPAHGAYLPASEYRHHGVGASNPLTDRMRALRHAAMVAGRKVEFKVAGGTHFVAVDGGGFASFREAEDALGIVNECPCPDCTKP